MAFRNPTHTLPAYAIRGQIPGHKIDGPLNPGTVTSEAIAPNGVQLTHLEKAIMAALSQKWWDFGDSATRWAKQGTPSITSVSMPDASGGVAMRVTGYSIQWRPDVMIPYDPRALYRVSATVRQTVAGSSTANQRVYLGLAGFAADRATMVNIDGLNSTGSQAYAAARGTNLTAGAGWQTFTGYVSGYGAVKGDAGPNPSMLAPMALHPSVRYISPLLYLNYTGGTGTAEVDTVTVEVVRPGVVDGAVQIIPGTVIADRLSADAIDGKTVNGLIMNAGQLNAVEVNGVDITGTSSITGATIQTSATGRRIVLDADHLSVLDSNGDQVAEINPGDAYGRSAFASYNTVGTREFYSALTAGELRFGVAGVTDPATEAYIAFSDLGGGATSPYELLISSGNKAGAASSDIILYSETSSTGDNARIDVLTDVFNVDAKLTAKNIRTGRVSITTTPNVPTSVTVTGLGLAGTTPRAVATANTSVPGTSVLGVGCNNVTTDAVTIWLTRVNSGPTAVDYIVIGE